jgi:hypothetical protein
MMPMKENHGRISLARTSYNLKGVTLELIFWDVRDKNARLIFMREIHSAEQNMLCLGGIARIEGGKVISEVPDVKILLPDSGAQKNEISHEIADALGLYADNILITTTNGTYETFKCRLTLALSPEDVRCGANGSCHRKKNA